MGERETVIGEQCFSLTLKSGRSLLEEELDSFLPVPGMKTAFLSAELRAAAMPGRKALRGIGIAKLPPIREDH